MNGRAAVVTSKMYATASYKEARTARIASAPSTQNLWRPIKATVEEATPPRRSLHLSSGRTWVLQRFDGVDGLHNLGTSDGSTPPFQALQHPAAKAHLCRRRRCRSCVGMTYAGAPSTEDKQVAGRKVSGTGRP
ncbi:hypothetical protein HPB50_023057 [Hyalomma asiaticum]|uniref:Uncharacterized protein n=1 Tax=Hyalomma asiaticum TaxID=266040 RepID=A0ACB7TPN4_HYAAI|nr:hypothetical protein HPB50_023057 [Hyalomma asiaticum]